jgi:DNA-binding beta-propeller fold protein YncE
MLLVRERGSRIALAAATIAVALITLLAVAQRSQASELIYWNNYGASPQSISVANIDGSGGGSLNLAGATLVDPEGMAIDTVTNRLYVVSSSGGPSGNGEILYVNLDGSGAGVFSAPGALVDEPFGVVLDPVTRMIYWANDGAGVGNNGSIAWAKLDGSAGGLLNTSGASVVDPYKIGLDPVHGRVYWGSYPGSKLVISSANANNTGGGTDLSISPAPESAYAFAVDPAAGRLYWSEGDDDRFAYSGLTGGTSQILDTTGAVANSSYGFAVDPTLNRILWPNYDNDEDRVNGLGFASLSGGGGGNITPQTAPFDGPQDLLVLKSPTGTGAPAVTRNAKNRTALSCPTGSWAADFAGSFVYQAPTTYAYQWLRNGAAISGATSPALTATKAGSYTCTVTAANQAGSATQTSAGVNVKAAKVKLTTKKKAKAEAGDLVTFKVKAVNQGDIAPKKSTKLCVKLPGSAKDDLKAPKCKKIGAVKGQAKKTLTLKVKVKGGADEGAAKLTFQVKGAAGKAAKSKIVVK